MEKLRKKVVNELFDVFVKHIGVKKSGKDKFVNAYTSYNPPASYHLLGKVGPNSIFWYDLDGDSPRNSILSTWKTAKIRARVDTANMKIDVILNKELHRKQHNPKKETLVNRIKANIFDLIFNITERWRK